MAVDRKTMILSYLAKANEELISHNNINTDLEHIHGTEKKKRQLNNNSKQKQDCIRKFGYKKYKQLNRIAKYTKVLNLDHTNFDVDETLTKLLINQDLKTLMFINSLIQDKLFRIESNLIKIHLQFYRKIDQTSLVLSQIRMTTEHVDTVSIASMSISNENLEYPNLCDFDKRLDTIIQTGDSFTKSVQRLIMNNKMKDCFRMLLNSNRVLKKMVSTNQPKGIIYRFFTRSFNSIVRLVKIITNHYIQELNDQCIKQKTECKLCSKNNAIPRDKLIERFAMLKLREKPFIFKLRNVLSENKKIIEKYDSNSANSVLYVINHEK